MSKLNELWCVSVHEKGAVMVHNLKQMLDVNEKMAMNGEHSGYMPVAIYGQFLDAEEKKRAVQQGWQAAREAIAGTVKEKNNMERY